MMISPTILGTIAKYLIMAIYMFYDQMNSTFKIQVSGKCTQVNPITYYKS